MALWMETGSEPTTQSEKDDLDAIAALKHSVALELKVSLSLSLSLYMYIHTHTHACPSMYELNRASGCLKLKVIVVDNNSEFIYLIMLLYCFLHSHII